jgi:hypothetical protein
MRSILRVTLFLLLLGSATGFGQSTYGSIVGVITDSTGAVIVGGTVTVTNTETNIGKVVNTSGNGSYEATHLLPGTYRVRIEFEGFKSAVRDGIVVESRAVVRIDFQLEVGSTRVEVQVTASTPVIETETAQIADTRTARQLRDLPSLSNDSTFAYLLTLPGAQSVSINTYSFNGSRAAQSDIMIDGISAPRSTTALGGTHNTLAMVSEVRLHGSNNSAEFQAPGVVSIVTRAGTNQLRGTLLYQHNNSALDARDFFSPKKQSTKTHTFGALLGGPVYIPKVYDGHDRTFFTLSLWGQRVPGRSTLTSTVPTPAMRQGDFSAFAAAITDPTTGQPFPGNAIPPGRFSPVALRVQERFYPLPNFGDPNLLTSNNNRTQMGARNLANRWEARLDQKISGKNMIYARFSWRGAVQEPFETLPTIPVRNGYRRGSTFVLSDAHTFGTSLVNEFRFGRQSSPNQVLGSLSGLEVLRYTGIQGITPPGDYRGMPQFVFNGLVTDATSTTHTNDRYHSFTVSDNLTWVRGKHTAKWGFDLVHNGNDGVNVVAGTFGVFSFNGYFTGNAYADFLLGLPERAGRAIYRDYQDIGGYSQYLFFEDAWRISSRITLTLGARYEYQFASTDSEGLMYNLDPRTMDLVVPDKAFGSGQINPLLPPTIKIVKASEAGYPQTLRAVDKNNLVPRIGLAVRPFRKTVIRAGYGIFIDDFGFSVTAPSGAPLYGFTEIFQNTNRRQPQYTFPNPYGVSGSIGTITGTGFKVDLTNPYSQQWNLTVEREVAEVGLRLSYIGTKGTSLGYTRQMNVPLPSTTPFSNSRRPYPQYGGLLFSDNGGNSIYHGLQADAERRFGRGLYFQAAWTWSNLISDVGDSRADLGPTTESPFDRRRDRGREFYSVRHRVTGSLIYDLPVGRGRRFLTNMPVVLKEVAGGWTASTLLYFETGRYFTPSFSGRDISGTGATGGRPDCIANGNLPPSQRQILRWFDPSAFTIPAANSGRFGNCGVNTLEGPGLNAQHFSLTKRFYERNEHTNLEFQFSILNLFNHPNFNLPSANISTPSTVAQVQSTRPLVEAAAGRTMTAILRLNF